MIDRRAFMLGTAAVVAALPVTPAPAASYLGETSWGTFTYTGMRVARIKRVVVDGVLRFATLYFESDDTTGSMSTEDLALIDKMELFRKAGTFLTMELRREQPSVSFIEEDDSAELAASQDFEDWDEEGRRHA